jgi:nucleoside-diphosphate kinase
MPPCRPFFKDLVEYMISGPVIAMVWEGKGVVKTGRKIIGARRRAPCAVASTRQACVKAFVTQQSNVL